MTRSTLAATLCLISLLSFAAMAGFFYAYSVSAMFGLDYVDSKSAIVAMQGINATVRNGWFAVAFFGSVAYGAVAAIVLALLGHRPSAVFMAVATIIYIAGTMGVTVALHIPLNESLAIVSVDQTTVALDMVWDEYYQPWLFWNHVRMAFAMISVLLTGMALIKLPGKHQAPG